MAALMGITALASSVSAGFNAYNQQAQIKSQVCQLSATITKYKKMMVNADQILKAEAAQDQMAADEVAQNIRDVKSEITLLKARFRKTYNTWTVVSVIFMMILVFVFASKKIILHATTEPGS